MANQLCVSCRKNSESAEVWTSTRDDRRLRSGWDSEDVSGAIVRLNAGASTDTPLLITMEEAAALLQIGRTMMFDLVAKGQVKTVRLGRRRLIVREELEAFVRALSF